MKFIFTKPAIKELPTNQPAGAIAPEAESGLRQSNQTENQKGDHSKTMGSMNDIADAIRQYSINTGRTKEEDYLPQKSSVTAPAKPTGQPELKKALDFLLNQDAPTATTQTTTPPVTQTYAFVPQPTVITTAAAPVKKPSFAELLQKSKEQQAAQAAASKVERSAEQLFGDVKGSLTNLLKKGVDANVGNQIAQAKNPYIIAPPITAKDALKIIENKNQKSPSATVYKSETSEQFIPLPDAQTEGQKELQPDDSQQNAINSLVEEKFGCLIGAAGTGKTFTLKRLLKKIEEDIPQEVIYDEETRTKTYKLSIRFLAFTGRAVQQMKRQLPKELHQYCGTIHGEMGLAYAPTNEEYINDKGELKKRIKFEPRYNFHNKMSAMLFIIDEAGMLSVELWNKLVEAMKKGARVFFVGDINQLPPVYGRSILGYGMHAWPTFELTTIHRQALDNPIIYNAHKILNGVAMKDFPGNFRLFDVKTNSQTQAQIAFLARIKGMHQAGIFDPFRDAIIVAYNVGHCGSQELNTILAPYFNPPNQETGNGIRISIQTGITRVNFAIGDKVMLHANDKATGLTNGQTGRIVSIQLNGMYKNSGEHVSQAELEKMRNVEIGHDFSFDTNQMDDAKPTEEDFEVKDADDKSESASQRQSSHIVTVDFGTGKEISFNTAGQFRKLSLAYVITCHKSQGGEYPTVVILCHSSQHKLLSREWLYTAVTRAQEKVAIVYNGTGIMQALNTQRIKGRTLQQKIDSFLEASKQIPGLEKEQIVPNLPMREKV